MLSLYKSAPSVRGSSSVRNSGSLDYDLGGTAQVAGTIVDHLGNMPDLAKAMARISCPSEGPGVRRLELPTSLLGHRFVTFGLRIRAGSMRSDHLQHERSASRSRLEPGLIGSRTGVCHTANSGNGFVKGRDRAGISSGYKFHTAAPVVRWYLGMPKLKSA